jgi:hypothetical protein
MPASPACVATCHCGAVRLTVARAPRSLTACNCSLCRRLGVRWAYYTSSSVQVEAPLGGLATYAWGRRTRLYHRCKACGCTTHYTFRNRRKREPVAVNANLFEPPLVAKARVRLMDGAKTGRSLD